MAHCVTWFDIPVDDLDRAVRFYSAMLGVPVERENHGDTAIGVLPHADSDVGGCLHPATQHGPTADGVLIYLNVNGRIDAAMAAVEANGGSVLRAKHAIGPYGWRAIILDSEGNRLALHSRS